MQSRDNSRMPDVLSLEVEESVPEAKHGLRNRMIIDYHKQE